MAPETFSDALIECVKACGGSKAVAVHLWGTSAGVEAAQRRLLACLNPERAEKLSLDEVVQVMRLARDRGCHAGVTYLARELGYADPIPVEPEDERAALQREFIETSKAMARMAARIEQLSTPSLRAAA